MKILAIADVEEKALWDFFDKDRVKGVQLIISCGDLKVEYLDFLVSMMNVPLLYVPGNHDEAFGVNPPDFGINIDESLYDCNGLRILGLGGSMRYKLGTQMYSEKEMSARIRRLGGRLSLLNGCDVLVTHAPAAGYGDLEDPAHKGFECFNDLLDKYHPKYMLHGHVHTSYGHAVQTDFDHPSGTKIMNVCGYRVFDIPETAYPAKGRTGSFLYDLYVSLKKGRA